MNSNRTLSTQSIFIGFVIILSVALWSFAFYSKEIKTYKNTVTVIGVATKNVTSDFANWRIEISTKSIDRSKNITSVTAHKNSVVSYLLRSGFAENEISEVGITVDPIYKQNPNGYGKTDEILSYETKLTLLVLSSNVQKIRNTSISLRTYAEENAININNTSVEYSYLPFESEKIPLLKKAIIDAQNRANALVQATEGVSKTHIGKIVSAQQGVFQINAANDNSVSDYGNYDTTSVEKTIRTTVTVEFQAN